MLELVPHDGHGAGAGRTNTPPRLGVSYDSSTPHLKTDKDVSSSTSHRPCQGQRLHRTFTAPRHIDAMHRRPLSSWSETLRKRLRFFLMDDENVPSRATCECLSSNADRGTRTWSKASFPLSTPFTPGHPTKSSSQARPRRAARGRTHNSGQTLLGTHVMDGHARADGTIGVADSH